MAEEVPGIPASKRSSTEMSSSFIFQEEGNVCSQNKHGSNPITDEHIKFSQVMDFWKNIGRKKSCTGADLSYQHTDRSYYAPVGRTSAETNGAQDGHNEKETAGFDKLRPPETICVEIVPIQEGLNDTEHSSCLPKGSSVETNVDKSYNEEKEAGIEKLGPPETIYVEIVSTQEGSQDTDVPSCVPKGASAETDDPKESEEGKGSGKLSPPQSNCEEECSTETILNNTDMSSCPPRPASAETKDLKASTLEEETGFYKLSNPERSCEEVSSTHEELNQASMSSSPPSMEARCPARTSDLEEKSIADISLQDVSLVEQSYPQVCSLESSYAEVNQTSSQESSDSDDSSPDDNTSDTGEEPTTSMSEEENEEEFDLQAYIETICQRKEDSDSELSDTNSNSSEALTRRAVRKVVKKLRKTSAYVVSDSESSLGGSETVESDDDSLVESSSDESVTSDDESTLNNVCSDTDAIKGDATEGTTPFVQPKSNYPDAVHVHVSHSDQKPALNTNPTDVDKGTDPSPLPEINEGSLISLNNGEMTNLDSNMTSALRWPSSNFYIKQLDTEQLSVALETPLPSYRSKRSSSSVSGRKRNVMLGRVWWVEWWAVEDGGRPTHTHGH